jgi:hypothetical protein
MSALRQLRTLASRVDQWFGLRTRGSRFHVSFKRLILLSMDARLEKLFDHFSAFRSASEVNPRDIDATLLPHVYVLDIEGGADAAPTRLRVRLTGTALSSAFGRPLIGLYLEDFLHGPRASDVVGGFHDCAEKNEKIWMREVVRIKDRAPRFVEGVAIPLAPARIYGGLLVGELAVGADLTAFERRTL